MLTDPPRDALDLLVVGGLTIDRFADGSTAPGGSVVHIARAAASAGIRLGILTATGPEPDARAALEELRHLAVVVESTTGAATIRYRHLESASGRQLWLERAGPSLTLTAGASARLQAPATLFAPVAGEIGADLVGALPSGLRGAILQGWLRTTDEGQSRPAPLTDQGPQLVAALGGMALLTASREDLQSRADEPVEQLTAMRRLIGPGPTLLVTDGAAGAWIDDGFGTELLPVPRRVDGVSSIGAGDVFSAFTLLALAAGPTPYAAAASGMRAVVEMLEARATRG